MSDLSTPKLDAFRALLQQVHSRITAFKEYVDETRHLCHQFDRAFDDEIRKASPWPSPGAALQQVNLHLSGVWKSVECAISESDLIRRDRDDPPQRLVERFEANRKKSSSAAQRPNNVTRCDGETRNRPREQPLPCLPQTKNPS